ncbi:radical SAM protein [Paenibacillus yonginensis]|uniref:radical SAM protein n=1 Tax=Paenibacillus yonginensis TaxID=1462996 RepID=UPI0009F3BF65|nr:radical SAM protein [Paenibacillus yonginensis]
MTYKALELEQPDRFALEGLEVGITSNCNFRCDYCCAYQRNDGEAIHAKSVIRVLEEVPTLKRVRLSGGEVTLKYDDCLEVVRYCSSRGIHTQLNSNGSLLNPRRIAALSDAGLTSIHMSFNFTNAEAFSAYYGIHPSVYKKIRENILRFAQDSAVDTVLETLLFEETQDKMRAIHEDVYSLGVRIHEIQNSIVMNHTGWRAIAARDRLQQAVQELIDMKQDDMTLYFTCMDRFMDKLGFKEAPGVYFPNCIEGKKQLHLHGNGDLLISELCYPVKIGNVYKGTSLARLYEEDYMPAPLADFLKKQPCPALTALFPEDQTV